LFEDGFFAAICSLKGISTILFMVMMIMILLSGTACSEANINYYTSIELERKRYDYEVFNELRDESGFVERPRESLMEKVCEYQELAMPSIAVAVLICAVLKQIIPRAKAMSLKKQK